MKARDFIKRTFGGCLVCFLIVLSGCSGVGIVQPKKYTPLTVYCSSTWYFNIFWLPDFQNYPNDLTKLGLRDSVKEIKATSPVLMCQKFNKSGNLIYSGEWFDSSRRFGDAYALEYDEKGNLSAFYNTRTKGGSGASAIYTYDEQNRLIERNSQYYNRTFRYSGEGDDYTATTDLKSGHSDSDDFALDIHGKNLTIKWKRKPEGYWLLDGYTCLSAEVSSTEMCKKMVATFYLDKKYSNKLDSIVSTYSFTYNDKDDVERRLIHVVEYPSEKVWDCQVDYTYEYDKHGNWTQRRFYSTDLRRLFGDFATIQTDENGNKFIQEKRSITYYEVGKNEEAMGNNTK